MNARLQHGATYLFVMFIVLMMGVALAAAGTLWSFTAQREKEKDLLFMGNQFRQAIGGYYNSNPTRADRYPREFKDLLEDRNHPVTRRYLRRIYVDPFTGKPEWGLIKNPQGGIVGVYSLHDGATVKRANFGPADAAFAGKERYAEWQFIFDPGVAAHRATAVAADPGTTPAQSRASPFTAPPPVASAAPRPVSPLIEKNKTNCTTIAQSDAQMCAAMAARWGAETGQACQSSAAARQGACAQGANPLPQLYVRYF